MSRERQPDFSRPEFVDTKKQELKHKLVHDFIGEEMCTQPPDTDIRVVYNPVLQTADVYIIAPGEYLPNIDVTQYYRRS